MTEGFKPSTPDTKPPEYDFESGVKEAISRIVGLLKTLDRNVYVLINGSGINVGKTKLQATIQGKLSQMGVSTSHVLEADISTEGRVVFVTVTQGLFWKTGEDYRSFILQHTPDAPGNNRMYADLYVGVYRPDIPFRSPPNGELKPLVDILIRNDKAVDK